MLAFSHSQRVLHSSCDDPSDCFVSHLAHTFIYRIRQTGCHHYRCLNPVDRVGNVVRSTFQHTSVGLQLTIDRHKHCRSDASWMPSRLSTVLAHKVAATCRNSSNNRCATRSSCNSRKSSPTLSVRPHQRCTLGTHVRSLHYVTQLERLNFACTIVNSFLHNTHRMR